MAARHRRDAVPPRLLAGDSSVPVVVIQPQGIGGRGGRGARRFGGAARAGNHHAVSWCNPRARARGRRPRGGRRLARYLRLMATTRAANQQRFIGGSHSAESKAHLPPVPQRFTSGAARVRLRRSEAKRRRSGGAGGAETAVVGLRDGDDVLDVGVPEGTVVPSGVRTVDPAAHGSDDLGLDRLRIGVVAPVVRGAAVLGRDDEAAPGVSGEHAWPWSGDGTDRNHGERERRVAAGEPVISSHGDTCGWAPNGTIRSYPIY